MAARDLANALQTLVEAARGVAAHFPDLDSKLKLLESAKELIDHSDHLLHEAQAAVQRPGNPDSRQKMAKVSDKSSLITIATCSEFFYNISVFVNSTINRYSFKMLNFDI